MQSIEPRILYVHSQKVKKKWKEKKIDSVNNKCRGELGFLLQW